MATRGRPAKSFTDDQRKDVMLAARAGVPHEAIARLMKIDVKTLTKYFDEELFEAKTRCLMEVAKTAYEMAISKEQPAMTMFYLKTQGKWQEVQKVEQTVENKTPVQLIIDIEGKGGK